MGTTLSDKSATLRDKHNGGFEQARNAYFDGEGLGRRFLTDFLPLG